MPFLIGIPVVVVVLAAVYGVGSLVVRLTDGPSEPEIRWAAGMWTSVMLFLVLAVAWVIGSAAMEYFQK